MVGRDKRTKYGLPKGVACRLIESYHKYGDIYASLIDGELHTVSEYDNPKVACHVLRNLVIDKVLIKPKDKHYTVDPQYLEGYRQVIEYAK